MIKQLIAEHGEGIINKHDSSHNYLMHHMGLIFEDADVDLFTQLLVFLTSASTATDEVRIPLFIYEATGRGRR